MSENLTEEQQVEELKKWWKENGRSIVIGAVLGLGIIGGWQGWQGYQASEAEAGATAYDQFASRLIVKDSDAARSALDKLNADHAGTLYLDFANLQMAMGETEAGNIDAAIGYLQQVISGSSDSGLVQVAALRLAQLYVGEQKNAEARQALAHIKDTAFEAESLAIEGRVALAEGNLEAARIALSAALDKGAADSEMIRYLLQQLEAPNS